MLDPGRSYSSPSLQVFGIFGDLVFLHPRQFNGRTCRPVRCRARYIYLWTCAAKAKPSSTPSHKKCDHPALQEWAGMGVPSHANPLNIFHLQALVCPLTLTRSKPLVPLATTTAPSTS